MVNKLMMAALLLAGGSLANAADAPAASPPGGGMGGGMGGMMRMSPEERFKMMDKNGDGKITLEEFVAAQAMMRGPGGPPPGAGPGPGAGQAQPPAGSPPGGPPGGGMMRRPPEERFKMMDANHDGVVTLDEYKAMMERMRAMMGGADGPPPGSPPPEGAKH